MPDSEKPPSAPVTPADVAAAPADAETTPSGLASKVLRRGSGTERPGPTDKVKVHYSGWTTDGKMFDSSVTRGSPVEFPLDQVIPGWTEGLQLMTKGEQRRFWIPQSLAYANGGGPQGTLVFDVELFDFTPGPKPVPAPEDVAAPPQDAVKTASGLYTKVLAEGSGKARPAAEDTVTVEFTAWTPDGRMLDSTSRRGQPAVFPASGGIPAWTEALQLMTKGEKRRVWAPKELVGRGGSGAESLVFDLELVDFVPAPKPIPAPADVKAAPKDAQKSASGLASKVLKKGTGTAHPSAQSLVQVHYTGWTTDGKMFDSSVMRGEPAQFPLNGVIKGWTEGVQLMVEGETRRFWIPGDLAYGNTPNDRRPYGTLVFDVELLKIVR